MALLCFALATAAPIHAQTKMFKCMVDGRTVYQQTGCPVVSSQTDEGNPKLQSTSSDALATAGASSVVGRRALATSTRASGKPAEHARPTARAASSA
jgi:hypothetical protein